MKSLKEVSFSFIAAIASSIIVLGAILVAMTEGITLSVPTVEPTFPLPVIDYTLPPGVTPPTPAASPTQPRPVIATITPTPICQNTPSNWERSLILPGDTLRSLAAGRGIPVEDLMQANCFQSANIKLSPNTYIYLPPVPTPTNTITITNTLIPTSTQTSITGACSNTPPGWVRYTVQSGDSLYKLSSAVGISDWRVLMTANCLTSINIITGDVLYLPRTPARTPTFTRTATSQPTSIPTRVVTRTPTQTIPPTTAVPTDTSTPTSTNTPTPTDTDTPEPTPTPTPTPTDTPEPTATPTPTPEPTLTETGTSTPT